MAKHFVLTMEAIIIHLKLKTDDSPNISIADLDLICDVLPKIAEMITVTMIRGFSMKITKQIGAAFCHVIRIAPLVHLIFFITSMNHPWNGAAASLIRIAEVPAKNRILAKGVLFCRERYKIKIADAID